MGTFLYDAKAFVTLRVTAKSQEEAESKIRSLCCDLYINVEEGVELVQVNLDDGLPELVSDEDADALHLLPSVLSRQQARSLYAQAASIYQNSRDGAAAVLEWAEAYNFPHGQCEACEMEVPFLVEEGCQSCCLVCGSAI